MRPADYVFLETREARMLAAAWPEAFAEARENVEKASDDTDKWRRIAGIEPRMLPIAAGIALANGLRWNRICLDDGTLDPDAAAFIKQAAYAQAGLKSGEPTPEKLWLNPVPRDVPIVSSKQMAELGFIEFDPKIGALLEETLHKLRDVEAERDRYAVSIHSLQERAEVMQLKIRAIEGERDETRRVAEEILAQWDEEEGSYTVEEIKPQWIERAGLIEANCYDKRDRHHPGKIGPTIPKGDWTPTGHAATCTPMTCAPHCKMPRKSESSAPSG